MIVLSLILVIAAAVLLIAGFFQTGLTLIYASIGACVLAMIFLGIGVLQRKRSRPAPQTGGYGPGAGTAPIRPSGSARPAARNTEDAPTQAASVGGDESDVVVRKTSAADAPKKKAVKKVAAPSAAAAAPAAETEPSTGSEEPAGAAATEDRPPAREPQRKAAPTRTAKKKSTKKAATKKTAGKKKTAAKKRSAKKKSTTKKKSTKRAAAKTTGAAARQALSGIKGIGPAKQDALLERFGSLEAIRDASVDELSQLPGIGESTARGIKRGLR